MDIGTKKSWTYNCTFMHGLHYELKDNKCLYNVDLVPGLISDLFVFELGLNGQYKNQKRRPIDTARFAREKDYLFDNMRVVGTFDQEYGKEWMSG